MEHLVNLRCLLSADDLYRGNLGRAGSQKSVYRRELRLERIKLLGTTSVERLQPFAELAICFGRGRHPRPRSSLRNTPTNLIGIPI